MLGTKVFRTSLVLCISHLDRYQHILQVNKELSNQICFIYTHTFI